MSLVLYPYPQSAALYLMITKLRQGGIRTMCQMGTNASDTCADRIFIRGD